MDITIIGDGSFGSFLKELLSPSFDITGNSDNVVLAVPISAYDSVAKQHKGKHLINVCSVQKPSTDICLDYSHRVTSIHPLFGRRTPLNKRYSIITHTCPNSDDFLHAFVEAVGSTLERIMTPEEHDIIMAKTHKKAVMIAELVKFLIEDTSDIEDFLIPNSFRMLREFVKTMDDMPSGTIESIMANPY